MDSKYKIGQKVDLIIARETQLGFLAIINGVDEGLLYFNEIFENLRRNQRLPGYIKKIRPDGTIDLILHPIKNRGAEELGDRILDFLDEHKGYMPLNAKSKAELIYDAFGVSRNKFKIALGALYKKRLITFTDEGTNLVPTLSKSKK